jgi:hypothetical protein
MPKNYYCDKIVKGKICGETNIDNFTEGRYSTCKKCRASFVSEYSKSKKIKAKAEINISTTHLKWFIEDIMLRNPILNNKSVLENFNDLEENITEVYNFCHKKLEDKFEQMTLSIKELKEENEVLKLKIRNLEEKL